MSANQSPIIATELVRHFGSVKAVDGVDLEVHQGEIFGFLGPNGAGKSTVIRMLTTLLRPTSGSAQVAGYDIVTQANDVRRNIGVALQDAAIDPLMTGNELLHLQAVLYGLPASMVTSRSDELLERVGLVGAADRRVGTYSGGMRRRLDLALSLIHQPTVLFLDEPTTGLDPMSRITLWEEVRRLNREGTTVLLTTQYLEEADQLADRVAIIDHGKIVKEGTPTALKAEVGSPTLLISVAATQALTARDVLERFGELRTTAEGSLGVGLEGGASAVTDVVRALDEAGVESAAPRLNEPSLDDVFAETTGYRLEAASPAIADAGGPAPYAKQGRRKSPRRFCAVQPARVGPITRAGGRRRLRCRAFHHRDHPPTGAFIPSLILPCSSPPSARRRSAPGPPVQLSRGRQLSPIRDRRDHHSGRVVGSVTAEPRGHRHRERLLHRLLATPTSCVSILLGRLAGAAMFGVFQHCSSC